MTIISARDAGASENGELENAKFLAPSLQFRELLNLNVVRDLLFTSLSRSAASL